VLDQQAALRWVRREIGTFGGDPARVTVMGHSAGANTLTALLAPGASSSTRRSCRAALEGQSPKKAGRMTPRSRGASASRHAAFEGAPAALVAEQTAIGAGGSRSAADRASRSRSAARPFRRIPLGSLAGAGAAFLFSSARPARSTDCGSSRTGGRQHPMVHDDRAAGIRVPRRIVRAHRARLRDSGKCSAVISTCCCAVPSPALRRQPDRRPRPDLRLSARRSPRRRLGAAHAMDWASSTRWTPDAVALGGEDASATSQRPCGPGSGSSSAATGLGGVVGEVPRAGLRRRRRPHRLRAPGR
jgi:para-nitrobenzyl esterase